MHDAGEHLGTTRPAPQRRAPPDAVTESSIHLLGFGVAAVDEMIVIPGPVVADAKIDLVSHETVCGGICVNALAAASRQGLTCHFAGPLGTDDLSQIIRAGLRREGIGSSHAAEVGGIGGPSHAFILVDRKNGARTIYMDKSRVRPLRAEEIPDDLLRRCRAVYLDSWHLDAGLDVARRARSMNIAIIADFEEYAVERVRPLLPLVDHLILPLDYACRLAGTDDTRLALRTLAGRDARTCTAITMGREGAIFVDGADHDRRVQHQRAFVVDTVDTTGCGDAFHGGYIAAFQREPKVAPAIRAAAATAAIKAQGVGAIAPLPSAEQVQVMLRRGELR